MADMTNEEYDALDELWTKTTPKVNFSRPGVFVSAIPEKYRSDIEKATFCLKAEGCTGVFLFGSIVTGKYYEASDIDLGITGLAPQQYIRTYSKLNNLLTHRFDLIDFDENRDMFNLLNSIGEIVKLG